MLQTICQWFLYFSIYSVLGWVCETVYCSIIQRKFVNRGFLNGPVCPVYGVGAVLVIYLLQPVAGNVPALFLTGMLVTTVLEYLTSVLLEKLFHMKWWDYSHFKLQINGRVCLLNSLMFGALSVFVMLVLHPRVQKLVDLIPAAVLPWISLGIAAVFIADTVLTVRSILILKGKLEEVRRALADIKEKSEQVKAQFKVEWLARVLQAREQLQDKADDIAEYLEKFRLPEGISLREYVEDRAKKLPSLAKKGRWMNQRLVRAFPSLNAPRYADILEQLKERLKVRRWGKRH
ncbi:MAG TPA: hypothetical protein IAC82_01170 [Candidatus Merdivicinus intestinigallinarum]|nr:hypothetical protein [Candidatus Merdivicinus intestinigallinarum]